jgi:hypothetical protein
MTDLRSVVLGVLALDFRPPTSELGVERLLAKTFAVGGLSSVLRPLFVFFTTAIKRAEGKVEQTREPLRESRMRGKC